MLRINKFLLLTTLILAFNSGFGQIVSTIDFVKVKNGNLEEAVFYYQNNWEKHRIEAVKRGVIESFELIKVNKEDDSQFDIILITRYPNQRLYEVREDNFRKVMKKTQKNGRELLNEKQPKDFREIVFSRVGESGF